MIKADLDREFTKYKNRLFLFCRKYVNRDELAEELVQDVYVRASRALTSFRGDSAVSTWLFRIASNLCTDRLSRCRVTLGSDDEQAGCLERGDVLIGGAPNPEHPFTSFMVRQALASLTEEEAGLLVLLHVEGYTLAEVSSMLDTPRSTLGQWKCRAEEKLRCHLSLAQTGTTTHGSMPPAALEGTVELETYGEKKTKGHRSYQMGSWLKAAGPKHPLTLQVLELPDVAGDEACVYAVTELAGGRAKGEINASLELTPSSASKKVWNKVRDAIPERLWEALERQSGDFQDSGASNSTGGEGEEAED